MSVSDVDCVHDESHVALPTARPVSHIFPIAVIAFHGSWNRRVPTGYKLVYVPLDSDGNKLGEPVDLLAHIPPNASGTMAFVRLTLTLMNVGGCCCPLMELEDGVLRLFVLRVLQNSAVWRVQERIPCLYMCRMPDLVLAGGQHCLDSHCWLVSQVCFNLCYDTTSF